MTSPQPSPKEREATDQPFNPETVPNFNKGTSE
jgi:hypothetical protein